MKIIITYLLLMTLFMILFSILFFSILGLRFVKQVLIVSTILSIFLSGITVFFEEYFNIDGE